MSRWNIGCLWNFITPLSRWVNYMYYDFFPWCQSRVAMTNGSTIDKLSPNYIRENGAGEITSFMSTPAPTHSNIIKRLLLWSHWNSWRDLHAQQSMKQCFISRYDMLFLADMNALCQVIRNESRPWGKDILAKRINNGRIINALNRATKIEPTVQYSRHIPYWVFPLS